MNLNFESQVAVVVGGANGIGRAIVEAFAREGAFVAILDRHPDLANIAAELAARHTVPIVGFACDVTDSSSLELAAQNVQREFSRCDHVVYAAGCGSGKFGFPFWELQPADWPRMLDVNLVGGVSTAHAFRTLLCESTAGSLLFLSSIAGQIGSQTDPPYSAAKAGLINFAQCAAKDFAPYGVRVNTICPGMVKTQLNRSVYEAWAARQPANERLTYETWAGNKIKQLVPLGRWQEAEDIADMAVFLASTRCKNVTGQTINVDGGFVMHW